ncbi:MAG TPA: DUF5681 domain-containing protein [Methylocystis sp.]
MTNDPPQKNDDEKSCDPCTRDKSGKFTRGNPTAFSKERPGRGRPKGSRNRATALAERMMLADTKLIVKSVVNAAKNGDMQACKIILDRISPIRKGRPISFDLPEARTANDVVAALAAVANAMAVGVLTPDEAVMVSNVLEIRRRAIETVELEKRIIALEEKG